MDRASSSCRTSSMPSARIIAPVRSAYALTALTTSATCWFGRRRSRDMSSFTTSGRSSSMNVNEAGSAPTSSSAIDQPSRRAEATVLNSSAGREVRARSVISRTTCAVEPLATASACIVRAVPSVISEGSTLRNRLTPRRSCRSAARKAAARHSSSSSACRSDRAAASNRAAGEVSSPDPRTRASYPTTRSDSRSQMGCRSDERPPPLRRSVTCTRVASSDEHPAHAHHPTPLPAVVRPGADLDPLWVSAPIRRG